MRRTGSLLALLLLVLPACEKHVLSGAPGTESGPCLEEERCRLPELACRHGICVVARALCENGQCAPVHPTCWTPCSGDLSADDGTVRVCSAEGLMEGCLGDSVCDRGSCVQPAAAQAVQALTGECVDDVCTVRQALTETECETDPRCCLSETGCPEHQRCIRGGCYSNCERDADCPVGQDCIRHACREPCDRTRPCPQEGEVCGDDGYCLALVDTEVPPVARPEGDFEVSLSRIAFTRNVQETELTITNTGAGPQTFVVRKLLQSSVREDGWQDVRLAEDGDTPLTWLRMGVGGTNAVQEFPVTIPGGRSSTVQISNARNPVLSRWTGALEVGHRLWGVHRIALSYGEGLKGSWRGKVHYFGVFPDGDDPETGASPLDAWRADRGNVALLDPVPNAFLKAWARFRNGAFSLTHLGALVDATLTGSWQYDRVQELCREAGFGVNAACAPTAGAGSESVMAYTSDRYIDRIPTGVVELDLALNLRQAQEHELADPEQCDGAEHCYVGRIVSRDALQYAGDPAVALTLSADPFSCDPALSWQAGCAVAIEALISRIEVGGRYLPDEDEPGCQAPRACAGRRGHGCRRGWRCPVAARTCAPVAGTRWCRCPAAAGTWRRPTWRSRAPTRCRTAARGSAAWSWWTAWWSRTTPCYCCCGRSTWTWRCWSSMRSTASGTRRW